MDLNKVVGALGNSGALGGLASGVAGGALTSALLSEGGKKHAKTLLKVGGLAAVGGLAWKACQRYQQSQGANGTASPSPSKADPDWQRLEQREFEVNTDLAPSEKALVVDELLHPRSVADIVAEVRDRATAIEVYAASLLAVDESREDARRYLDELAASLSLPPLLTEALASRASAERSEAA